MNRKTSGQYNREMMDFIEQNPTSFHVIAGQQKQLEEAGYTPMIYTSHEIADLRYDWDTLSAYRLWYPWYMSKGDRVTNGRFYPHMVIWQFSKRCEVDGVGKKVDGNLWFRPKY